MVRVGNAQYEASTDRDKNLDEAQRYIQSAGSDNADLLVLPEYAMYSDPDKEYSSAGTGEPLDGPWVSAIKEGAREKNVHVVVGVVEESADDERPYNTLVYIDNFGQTKSVYRKLHLYDAFSARESDRINPGQFEEPLVFSIGQITFGACTCYDLRFPEIFRWLVEHGATAFVVPAAWQRGPRKEEHWETLLKARAIENTSYMVGCGQTGSHCTGLSQIIDPMGVSICNNGEIPGYRACDLNSQRVEDVRKINPSLINRRFKTMPH